MSVWATFLFVLSCVVMAADEKCSGVITVDVDLSAHGSDEEARLWLPYPLSDNEQQISNIRYSGTQSEVGVYSDRSDGVPMLFARWDKGAAERRLRFKFSVDRLERKAGVLPQNEAAWDPADYAQFLKPTSLAPTDGRIKALAEEITKGKTTVLAKARAIYDWVSTNMYRDPQTRGCGSGDVCTLLDKPGGKCADIHSVFVALLRAARVPARDVFGIRQGSDANPDITGWQHCWAEFYVPGFGWVAADPADVLKFALTKKLKPTDPEVAPVRERYFGGLDAARVKFSAGRDLTLNPPQQGQPVNYLMYPYAQIGAKTLDWLDPETFKYTISYRKG
ncbi:MAG TPA: transglutaminase domain-containing protein [Planctomycetota bacterium]